MLSDEAHTYIEWEKAEKLAVKLIKPLFTERKVKLHMERFMLGMKKIKERNTGKGDSDYVDLDDLLGLFIIEFRIAKMDIQKYLSNIFIKVMRWKEHPTELTGNNIIEIMDEYKNETKF